MDLRVHVLTVHTSARVAIPLPDAPETSSGFDQLGLEPSLSELIKNVDSRKAVWEDLRVSLYRY